MYNHIKRQYLLKQSSGKVYNFYHDEKLGLCYSILTRRNTWTDPAQLQKNLSPSFYVDIDQDDRFNILFQDKQGNIFYTLLSDNNIKTLPVLNSKSTTAYNKHVHLIPLKNCIHIFFVILHNDSLLLAHQTLSEDTASTPKVIDYVGQNIQPYSVVCDNAGNIYAFYQSSDGKYLQLGYKKYLQGQKFWGEFTPVTRYKGNCEFPRVIIDGKGIMHICYQRLAPKNYELVYQQKIPDKNLWTSETVIHSSAYSYDDSAIVYSNDSIYIYWVRDDIIYNSSSSDGGNSWSKPAKYNFPAGRQLVCFSYRTNHTSEVCRIVASSIPGSFINGFKLAFYQDASGSLSNLTPEELKNTIMDTLKLLKGSVEDLRESYTKINETIMELNTNQQNLEKELTKYGLKLNLLENDISRVKTLSSQPYNNDFYKGIMADIQSMKRELSQLKKVSNEYPEDKKRIKLGKSSQFKRYNKKNYI